MIQDLLHWLQGWGYVGVALGVFLESTGLPIPGETVLLVAAFAAARGSLELPWIITVAAGAGVLGDNLGYVLGRHLGRGWLEKHGHRFLLRPDRLVQMERFFDRFGAAAIAVARFVTGVRVVAAFSAGVARLRWLTFISFNVLGAALWATVIGLLGYAAGEGSTAFGIRPWMIGAAVVSAIALLVGGAFLRRRLREPIGRRLAGSFLGRLVGWELWILALSLTGLVLFAKIAEDVAEAETGPFDTAIRGWMLAHAWPPFSALFRGLSLLGSMGLVVPLTLAAAAWFWFRRRRLAPLVVLVASLLGSGFFLALKAAFHRSYPAAIPAGPGPAYSFPSGHATIVTAAAVTAAYIVARQRLLPTWAAAGVALVLVVGVGIGRVYLDLSRASDVVGGWAVGLFVAAVAATLFERLRARRPQERPRGPP